MLDTILVNDVWAMCIDDSCLLLDAALDTNWHLSLEIMNNVMSLLIWLVITHVHGSIVHLVLKVDSIALSAIVISEVAPKLLSLVLLLMVTRSTQTLDVCHFSNIRIQIDK